MTAAVGDAAVLIVSCGDARYAIDLRQVIEIRSAQSVESAVLSGLAKGVLPRNGVKLPVFDLRDALGLAPCATAPEAVLVLDLMDRNAALLVDTVCEVRIAATCAISSAPCAEPGPHVAGLAQWNDGSAPVLEITPWLRDFDFDGAEVQLAH